MAESVYVSGVQLTEAEQKWLERYVTDDGRELAFALVLGDTERAVAILLKVWGSLPAVADV